MRIKPYPDKLSVATYCIELRRRWDRLTGASPPVAQQEPEAVVPQKIPAEPVSVKKPVTPVKDLPTREERDLQKRMHELTRQVELRQAEADELARKKQRLADETYEAERALESMERKRSTLQHEVSVMERESLLLSPSEPTTPSKQIRGAQKSSSMSSLILFAAGFAAGALSVYYLLKMT